MDEQQDIWRHLIVTLISMAAMLVIVWAEMPDTQRTMITLEARARMQRLLNRSAHRAGRWGMSSELHEHEPSAVVSYGLAYRLSRLRDRI